MVGSEIRAKCGTWQDGVYGRLAKYVGGKGATTRSFMLIVPSRFSHSPFIRFPVLVAVYSFISSPLTSSATDSHRCVCIFDSDLALFFRHPHPIPPIYRLPSLPFPSQKFRQLDVLTLCLHIQYMTPMYYPEHTTLTDRTLERTLFPVCIYLGLHSMGLGSVVVPARHVNVQYFNVRVRGFVRPVHTHSASTIVMMDVSHQLA